MKKNLKWVISNILSRQKSNRTHLTIKNRINFIKMCNKVNELLICKLVDQESTKKQSEKIVKKKLFSKGVYYGNFIYRMIISFGYTASTR